MAPLAIWSIRPGGHSLLSFDPAGTLTEFELRSRGTAESADGTLSYSGPGNFDITLVDGEPVGFVARGPSGPGVPGV
jgi:hypothetical protein